MIETSPKINRKAISLLSGGLDSTLATKIVQAQGIEIEAVNFQTMFGCCKTTAQEVARELGIKFTLLKVGADYLKVVEKPRYGYGRGVNPCVDCRIYMFEMAKRLMEEVGASFLISGEVLGQRPMSQKMRDFKTIEADTGLEGKILRPLSAKRLPLTEPEKNGVIDRSRLFGIEGRSRRQLLELAEQYGIEDPPMPSAGCALTSPSFAKKVRDVFEHHPQYQSWEVEILRMGRHFRITENVKFVLAKNQEESGYFEALHPKGSALFTCANFGGPTGLLIGGGATLEAVFGSATKILLRYAQKPLPEICEIRVEWNEQSTLLEESSPAEESFIETLRIV